MGVPDTPRALDYWMREIRKVNVNRAVVVDRLHLSEDVYGPLFRGESTLTDVDRWVLEGWLLARGGVVVCCLPSRDAVLQNTLRTSSEQHHDRSLEVYDAYVKVYARSLNTSLLPHVTYSFEQDPSGATLLDAVENLSHRPEVPGTWMGLGSPTPSLLLVGERYNHPSEDSLVFRSTSGEYLRRALEYASIPWSCVHITNALDGADKPHPVLAPFTSKLPHVVAMGTTAARVLESQYPYLTFSRVPHPQYWRRFHHYDLAGYAGMFAQALSGIEVNIASSNVYVRPPRS